MTNTKKPVVVENEEFTTTSLSEIILRIRSMIDFADDEEVRLEMSILDSYIRFLDMTDYEWRKRLVAELNELKVKVHHPHIISFSSKELSMLIEDVPFDLKTFLAKSRDRH